MNNKFKLIIKGIALLGIVGLLSSCGGGGSVPDSGNPFKAIGDTGPAGGIVFYIEDNRLHGLEAAPADLPIAPWGCIGDLIGTTRVEIYQGAQNTADILTGCPDTPIAADIAAGYTLNGFSDWFLPSLYELNRLYLQKDVVGGFASISYWTSSEVDVDLAYVQDFANGNRGIDSKNGTAGVRAVRDF